MEKLVINEIPKLIDRKKILDNRGSFERVYCSKTFAGLDINFSINQENISVNNDIGTLRGLHFQRGPLSDAKIVTCLTGTLFDVVVDLRPVSELYLKPQTFLLDSNKNSLYVPRYFAHGFQTIEPRTIILYQHDNPYTPELYDGLNPYDEHLAINWPIQNHIISNKDRTAPMLNERLLNVYK